MVAAAMAGTVVLFLRPTSRWIGMAGVGLSLLIIVALVNPTIDIGTARKVSFSQLVDNVVSFLNDDNDRNLQDSKEWRLAWWNAIVEYTVSGPHFWSGKGFGINLADEDGFQVLADGSLRAPHNAHLQILARMGVPGLTAWVALQVAFAASMLLAARRARRLGQRFWVQTFAWLFAYWLAALTNMTFDVYLEGPQGGIWFWTILGLGLAAMRAARAAEVAPADAKSDWVRHQLTSQRGTHHAGGEVLYASDVRPVSDFTASAEEPGPRPPPGSNSWSPRRK
jgi:O-antigen ligase